MVSFRSSSSELDRVQTQLETAVESYRALVADIAQHMAAPDDPDSTSVRADLDSIAASLRDAPPAALQQFNGRIRAVLQERGKHVSACAANVQQERARTEQVVKEVAASLAQSDDDHGSRIRKTVETLRTLSRSAEGRAVRDQLIRAAESIEQGLDKVRKENQQTASHLHDEIRALQRRPGKADVESDPDSALRVYSRPEIEQKMVAAQQGQFIVLILKVRGLRLAAVQFSPDVADQLGSAFLVKMRSILPPGALIARWADEEFIAAVASGSAPSATLLCRTVAENLRGAYACTLDGKPVRAHVEVTVCAVDNCVPAQLPERVEASLARI